MPAAPPLSHSPLRRSPARCFRSSRSKSYLIPRLTNGNWAAHPAPAVALLIRQFLTQASLQNQRAANSSVDCVSEARPFPTPMRRTMRKTMILTTALATALMLPVAHAAAQNGKLAEGITEAALVTPEEQELLDMKELVEQGARLKAESERALKELDDKKTRSWEKSS